MKKTASQSATQTHTYKHFHLDIIASTEIRSLLRAPVLSISLMGWGGTKAALVRDESLYLLLCFILLPHQPRDLQPLLCPLPLSAPILFFYFLWSPFASLHTITLRMLPASLPRLIFFLNLDLVSLSETCFSTKRFPSDTAEEKYVSIVCEALLCPDYHTDRWITHIPPLPSNKLPAERPQRLHWFSAALKSHLSDSLDFPREKNSESQLRIWRAKRGENEGHSFPHSQKGRMWLCARARVYMVFVVLEIKHCNTSLSSSSNKLTFRWYTIK